MDESVLASEKENDTSRKTPQFSKLPVSNGRKKGSSTSGRKGFDSSGRKLKQIPGSGTRKQPLMIVNKK